MSHLHALWQLPGLPCWNWTWQLFINWRLERDLFEFYSTPSLKRNKSTLHWYTTILRFQFTIRTNQTQRCGSFWSNWLTDSVNDWVTDPVTGWLGDWLTLMIATDSVSQWTRITIPVAVNQSMTVSEWMSEWPRHRVTDTESETAIELIIEI